jgi:phosphoglycolate phosphatase
LRYRTFLFDFDYTLADATQGIVLSFRHAFDRLGLPAPRERDIKKTVGMPLPEAFISMAGPGRDSLLEPFARHFRAKADEVMTKYTRLYPGAVETLELLKEKGARTGIVTSKNHYRIDEALRKFDICRFVDVVVGREDVKNPKPDPEGLLRALAALGTRKEEALYVGDTLIDARAAQAAGVDFAVVLTGTTGGKEFVGYSYVLMLPSISQLPVNALVCSVPQLAGPDLPGPPQRVGDGVPDRKLGAPPQ